MASRGAASAPAALGLHARVRACVEHNHKWPKWVEPARGASSRGYRTRLKLGYSGQDQRAGRVNARARKCGER
eukprot:11158967-Lingulodinium_polyedra.AAC.1